MKKIGRLMVCLALCLFMFTGNVFMFTGNVYAAEYPSPDDLSAEERELLPYYNNGWTLNFITNEVYTSSDVGLGYYVAGYRADVYYLGKKVKEIDTVLKAKGKTLMQVETDTYTITDNHQLFMLCEDKDEALSTKYTRVVRYDLDTDECKELINITYLKNFYKLGDLKFLVSYENNVYLIFENEGDITIYKYDAKEDTFKLLNTIKKPSPLTWIVYDKKSDTWTSSIENSNGKSCFVHFNFEDGTYRIGDEFISGDYFGGMDKFVLYQVRKGIRYYREQVSILNENTGKYEPYLLIKKYDASTGKEETIYAEQTYSSSLSDYDFYAITHKGLIVRNKPVFPINNVYRIIIFDEERKTKKFTSDEKHNYALQGLDLWNYYYYNEMKAYPLYAPSDAKVTETNNTYTDRVTIKWQAVSGASGYNVYVNNKKVNASLITGNTYTVKGLNKGTEYDICVTSVSDVGESEKSSITKVKTGNVVLGDINNDQKVNIVDAMQIFHYVSGRNKKVNVTTVNADINGDGKVNITDAMKIFHYASGRNTEY